MKIVMYMVRYLLLRDEDRPAIGFIAHLDTAPDFCGENVNPQIYENYNGEDLPLGDSGKILSVKKFPHLKELKGRTLITHRRNHSFGGRR